MPDVDALLVNVERDDLEWFDEQREQDDRFDELRIFPSDGSGAMRAVLLDPAGGIVDYAIGSSIADAVARLRAALDERP